MAEMADVARGGVWTRILFGWVARDGMVVFFEVARHWQRDLFGFVNPWADPRSSR
jgi:hypothetical protein